MIFRRNDRVRFSTKARPDGPIGTVLCDMSAGDQRVLVQMDGKPEAHYEYVEYLKPFTETKAA